MSKKSKRFDNPKFYGVMSIIFFVLFIVCFLMYVILKDGLSLVMAIVTLSFSYLCSNRKKKLLKPEDPKPYPTSLLMLIIFVVCLLATVLKFSILALLGCILFLFAWITSIIINKTNKEIQAKIDKQNVVEPPKTGDKIFKTYMAAVTKQPYKNNIKSFIDNEKTLIDKDELWEGLSNTEIIEDELEDIEELPHIGGDQNDLFFIPEPDNEYDENAIRVAHYEYGDFGYIPKKHTIKVKGILSGPYSLDWCLRGGRTKSYTINEKGEEKVKIYNDDNYINLTFYYD